MNMLRSDPQHISTRMEHPSEFSFLANVEARGNSVDPRPHGVLPYTRPESSVAHQLCRLHAARPLESISHGASAGKNWELRTWRFCKITANHSRMYQLHLAAEYRDSTPYL